MLWDCSVWENFVDGSGGAREKQKDSIVGEGEPDKVGRVEEGCEGEDGFVPGGEFAGVGGVEDCLYNLAELRWHCDVDFGKLPDLF